MNKFLRTASTRRLLASIAGLILAIAAGTTIAIAAKGNGPVPPAKALPNAIHDALGASKVQGVNAQINFTNHLINTSEIQGTDPLLSGGSGQLWVSDAGQLRVELYGDNGDPAVVVNNNSWWISDPTANTVYEGTLPAQSASKKSASQHDTIPTVAQIQSGLTRLMRRLNVSNAVPGDVAGQPAYAVTVSPKHAAGLLGQVQLAWDAVHGVPLRFAVYAKGDSSPVLGITATGISYGSIDPSIFSITPPAGFKVVKVATPATGGHAKLSKRLGRKGRRAHAEVTGVRAVAAHVPFALAAPRHLVGLPRQSVSLLDSSGSHGAVITYGRNLGGIVVLEQVATPGSSQNPSTSGNVGEGGSGLSLPTVTIGRATGQELDTALGTMIRFTRGGVAYTVLGSVPPVAAVAAARTL